MTSATGNLPLAGKKGLVTGIANDKSIAYAVAKAIVDLGGEIAITYQNDKTARYTQPLAEALGAKLFLKLDVAEEGSLESVIAQCGEAFGEIDFAIHSMAFCNAEDLHGRVIDATEAGFDSAMNVSCHSFLRMAKALEPLMAHGGSLITMSSDVFPRNSVGTANGLTGMAGYLGATIFSFIVGIVASKIGYDPLFVCLSLFDIVGAIVVCMMLKQSAMPAQPTAKATTV